VIETGELRVGDRLFTTRAAGPEDGVPVLLLHGFPATSLGWEQVMRLLSGGGLRPLAFDQRGYSAGARPAGVPPYAIEELARDVLEVAEALGARSCHLVGHDWGASVAWYVAAHHPERVRSLTAVSVPHLAAYGWALRHDADQQQRASYIRLLRMEKAERVLLEDDARRLRAAYGTAVPTALKERYVRHFQEPGALTAALNWYRAMRADLAEIPAVRVPTSYVWSDQDEALGRAAAERCGDFVAADYEFVELTGVSHWVPEQAPEQLARVVTARVHKS
jgi:pimeloyl-ACP methyl ester carboxylesterase